MLYALDLGNKQTKLKSAKIEKVFPSYFVEAELYGNRSFFGSVKAERDIKDYESTNDKGVTYVWGTELDLTVSVTDTAGFGLSRYTSREFQLLADFALAEIAWLENTEEPVYVTVVTGLPSEDFKNAKITETVAQVLKGTHTVTIGNKVVTVIVDKLLIIPQPLGTVMDMVSDENGETIDKEFATANVGVVDIGGGTVLIDALRSMNMADDTREQLNKGAYSLFKQITTALTEDNIVLSEYELERAIRLTGGIWSPDNIQRYDLNPWIAIQSNIYTRRLASSIKTTYKGFGRMQQILITGGAAKLIDFEELQTSLFGLAHIVSDPEISNVRGFYKYGKSKGM